MRGTNQFFGKWIYIYDKEGWSCPKQAFDSKEEAIAAAKAGVSEYEREFGITPLSYTVGQATAPAYQIFTDEILESIQDQFCEQAGEAADGWMELPWAGVGTPEKRAHAREQRVERELQLEELSVAMHAVMERWLKKYNNQPEFFAVTNADTFTAERGAA